MTLAANGSGVVLGQFDIPGETILAGSKLVEIFGAGGSYASATYVCGGRTTVKTVKTVRRVYFYDPLGQSFAFEEDTELSGIDVWFAAAGNNRVVVQLREAEGGIPGQNIVAEAYLSHSDISTTTWTRATFTAPVFIPAGKQYFMVFLTDDAVASLKEATLGEFDAENQRWCTVQPYTIGVLVDSSNAQSWTVHNESDLMFRLIGPAYSPTTKTITLSPIAVTNADYAVVLASVERPTADCDVTFTLGIPSGETFTVAEGSVISFPSRLTGNISVSVTLTGTSAVSPKVAGDIQVVTGTISSPSTYVTRRIPIAADPNNLDCKITVIYEALLPSPATATVELDAGGVWTAASVPSGGEVPIGDGWYEITQVLDNFSHTHADTALRITVTGTALARPRLRNLRLIIVST